MRRPSLAPIGALLALSLAGPVGPTARAADPPPDLRQPGPIVLRSPVSFSVGVAPAGLAYDVQVSRTGMLATERSQVWQDVAVGTTARSWTVPLARGKVACVRIRITGTIDWGAERCAVRALDDSALTPRGRVEHLAASSGGGAQATVVYPGASLSLAGVPAGGQLTLLFDWLNVTGTLPHWGIAGQPEPTMATGFNDETSHAIGSGGTARVWADPFLPTYPVTGLAVIPSWMTVVPEVGTDPRPRDNELWGQFLEHADGGVVLTGSPTYVLPPHLNARFHTQLQVARGPMTSARSAWTDLWPSSSVTAVRLPLDRGEVLCARVRNVRDDGRKTPWHATCLVRPLDDAQASVLGGRSRAPDPVSQDGHSSRLAEGARLLLGQVHHGDRLGYVGYPDRARPQNLAVTVGGWRGTTFFGSATGQSSALWPRADLWWAVSGGPGRAALAYPRNPYEHSTSERISGVWVLPRWAQ